MKVQLNILVVDDEPTLRRTLTIRVEADGHAVTAVANAQDAAKQARRQACGSAIVDLCLRTASGLDLLKTLQIESPWTAVVLMTTHASVETAVEAMKRGAADYLPKPFTPA